MGKDKRNKYGEVLQRFEIKKDERFFVDCARGQKLSSVQNHYAVLDGGGSRKLKKPKP